MSSDPKNPRDGDFQEIAWAVFTRPAQKPRTIYLDFPQETLDELSSEGKDPVPYIYSVIALQGVKILFGNETDVTNITKEQFSTIQRYMASMGQSLKITCNGDDSDPWETAAEGIPVTQLKVDVIPI